jgi:hypothetical protein
LFGLAVESAGFPAFQISTNVDFTPAAAMDFLK